MKIEFGNFLKFSIEFLYIRNWH